MNDRVQRRPAKPDQDDGDEAEEDEGRVSPDTPIVVTGRRLDAARASIDASLGATTYALTNETVENRPGGETGSVADILTQAPGVSIAGSRLTVRGASPNRVRINDVIVPEAVADPAEHLSARLAETTRLLTGTLPAQFGAAPGGVINVTTKNGLYQHGGQAELFAGSDGRLEPALEWAGSAGGTSLFGSGSLERGRSDRRDAYGARARDRRDAVEGLAFADHVFDPENRVSLILGGSHERHRIGATSLGARIERSTDGYAVGSYQHSVGGFSLQTALFVGIGSDSAAFTRETRERRSSIGTQIDATQRVGTAHTIRIGLLSARAVAREDDGPVRRDRAARTPTALYVQDQWQLAPGLTFNPGLRAEWLRGLGSGVTAEPRASLVWVPEEDLSVHVGYARYAAAPPLGALGNAGLRDERDDYYDVGVQGEVGHLTLGIDGYWQQLRNALASRDTPGSVLGTPFAFARARRRGAELFGTYAYRHTVAWLNLGISRATGDTIVGGQGLFAPTTLAATARAIPLATDRPFTGSGGITERLGKLSLSATAQLSSGAVRTDDPARPNRARGPAQVELGLAGVLHAELADSPLDVRLDLTNLTDDRSATGDASALEGGWTYLRRGRAITIGVEKSF